MDGCGTPSYPPVARRHPGQAIRRHHIEPRSGSRTGPALPVISETKASGAAPAPAGWSSR